MPDFAFYGLVTLQIVIAVVLIFVMVRLVQIIRSQGGTIVPPDLAARLRKMFGRKGS